MTNTKLEIIGPYTPEHEGPFCTRAGTLVRIISQTEGSNDFPIVGLRHEDSCPSCWHATGKYFLTPDHNDMDLMNAEEVPVAREFWLVGCNMYETREAAEDYIANIHRITLSRLEIIHVREVLPEEPLAQTPSP